MMYRTHSNVTDSESIVRSIIVHSFVFNSLVKFASSDISFSFFMLLTTYYLASQA